MEYFLPWADYIKELAQFENVWCKVSGLATNANLENWKPADFTPYLDIIFKNFGIDRLMFAGDWPHALRAIEYSCWFKILCQYVNSLSTTNRQKIFYRNAEVFYRL